MELKDLIKNLEREKNLSAKTEYRIGELNVHQMICDCLEVLKELSENETQLNSERIF